MSTQDDMTKFDKLLAAAGTDTKFLTRGGNYVTVDMVMLEGDGGFLGTCQTTGTRIEWDNEGLAIYRIFYGYDIVFD